MGAAIQKWPKAAATATAMLTAVACTSEPSDSIVAIKDGVPQTGCPLAHSPHSWLSRWKSAVSDHYCKESQRCKVIRLP